jgi:phosphopantothenoylcysteine decarboxylase/phosphopantothenate--cysteine ligase
LDLLRRRGAIQIGPERGRLASGAEGDGRMSEPMVILGAIRRALGRRGPLAGRRVVVTAGGTREALDPVRFLGNRSSGRMGYALAQAAIDAGAEVTLVTSATGLTAPVGAAVMPVESAEEMRQAVESAVAAADALVMAAAVADFRPSEARAAKIKKGSAQEPDAIRLARNPDILASVNRPGLVKVGFAAETEDLIGQAQAKLAAKGLAMIVANNAVATIGSERSAPILLRAGQPPETLADQPKESVAETIIARLAALLHPEAP